MRGGTPTREELKRVLDDIFHRILDDGERTRAARASGPPPWTPEPLEDPLYDDLEPEDWDKVPYPPELWMEEWRTAVMCNDVDNVRPLLDDALAARNISMDCSSVDWQRVCRLSLVVAAQAHAINAKREWGDYSSGWPNSVGIPVDELPGIAGPAPEPPRNRRMVGDDPAPLSLPVTTITESCTAFFAAQSNWSAKYRKQAAGALLKFVSLNGNLSVDKITGSVTETFRTRLKEMPRLYGKSIYAGQSPLQAHTTAAHIRSELAKGNGPITLGKKKLPREQGERLATPMSMKTVNREFSVFTSWGKWMKDDPTRRRQLNEGECPFLGKAFKSSLARKEARLAGRTRVAFTSVQLAAMLAAEPFLPPPSMDRSTDAKVELAQAKFWAVLIALYTGMRLAEIAMLRPGDFQREDGVDHIALVSDSDRTFKSEAGDRKVPLHPDLQKLGLMDFARAAAQAGSALLLPGMKYSSSSDQNGANISKWFGRWRRAQDVASARTPFHAFRKTFETRLKSCFQGSDTLVDQIVGHEPSSIGALHYTDPLPLKLKAEAVAAIDYEIDLGPILAALNDMAQ